REGRLPDKGEVGGSSRPRPTINPVNTRLFSLLLFQGSHYKNHFANFPSNQRSPNLSNHSFWQLNYFGEPVAGFGNCTDDRLESSNPSLQQLLRSFAPTTHAKPSQLLADNGPLGLWADLSVELRSRGTEAKGPSLRQLRAVDTPPSVDYGSYVFPFPGLIPNLVRRTIGRILYPLLKMLLYI